MPRSIFKYELPAPAPEPQRVMLPAKAVLLHVAQQRDGKGYVWALVDPANMPEPRHLMVVGTGWPIEGSPDYVGTFHEGPFVWHVMEVTS